MKSLRDQPSMQRELPHAPAQRHQRPQHHRHAHPSHTGRGFGPPSVSPHIFGELSPVLGVYARSPTLSQTGLKSLNPGDFVQPQSRHIAANNPLSEPPAWQSAVLSRLQRKQMTRRDFCLIADRFNRDLTPLPLPSQLVAESFHSFRRPIPSQTMRSDRASSSKNRPEYLPKSKPHSCYMPTIYQIGTRVVRNRSAHFAKL